MNAYILCKSVNLMYQKVNNFKIIKNKQVILNEKTTVLFTTAVV